MNGRDRRTHLPHDAEATPIHEAMQLERDMACHEATYLLRAGAMDCRVLTVAPVEVVV
jgi:hypothetical protein